MVDRSCDGPMEASDSSSGWESDAPTSPALPVKSNTPRTFHQRTTSAHSDFGSTRISSFGSGRPREGTTLPPLVSPVVQVQSAAAVRRSPEQSPASDTAVPLPAALVRRHSRPETVPQGPPALALDSGLDTIKEADSSATEESEPYSEGESGETHTTLIMRTIRDGWRAALRMVGVGGE
eukprot:Hpha_TRINITY_DN20087_c0_g1::TRINITY_DN20087_c0_g1_i1::g.147863::m.147863